MRSGKLKAGVLSLALVVSVVITSIGSAIVLVNYYFQTRTVDYRIENQLAQNLKSAWALLLSGFGQLPYGEERMMDLFGTGEDSVSIVKKPWGVLDVGLVYAWKGKKQKRQAAMIGSFRNPIGKSALYLADEQRPLSLAGNTIIKGDSYIPKAGVKTTYIDRVGYQRKVLIEGSTNVSENHLPALDPEKVEHIKRLLGQNKLHVRADEELNYYRQSFFEQTLSLYEQRPLLLEESYEGNVQILSDEAIIVSSHAQLEDVLLIAPVIIIQQGFQGRLQAIATDSIVVEAGVKLAYPSALVLYSEKDSHIKLASYVKIAGTILVTGGGSSVKRQLILEENAIVEGMVYVDGYCTLKGSIYGHLAVRKFMLKTESTRYENHLLHATIDNSQLSAHFLSAGLWGVTHQKSVMQWLD